MVVANPGFLHYDGERYRRTVDADLLPHLYPVGALVARGVPVALGSDAPVVDPNPWAAIAASMSRQSANGVHVGGIGVPTVAAGDSHALGCQAHRVGYAGGLGGRGTGSDGGYARRVAYGPLRGDYRGRPRRVVRWYMSLTTTRPASLTVRQRKRPAFPFETRKSRPLQ